MKMVHALWVYMTSIQTQVNINENGLWFICVHGINSNTSEHKLKWFMVYGCTRHQF